MAKRTSNNLGDTIEGFAEDLGRLLGTARARAEGWVSQRDNLAQQLTAIRDTATELLGQLTGSTAREARAERRRARKAPGMRATASGASPRRKLSAKARKAISDAQKRRWAKLRKEADSSPD